MNSYDNLYSAQSPVPIHSSLATLNDGQKALQLTQLNLSNTFTPPGAKIIRPTTSDRSQQAKKSFLRLPTGAYYEHSSPESLPHPFYKQSDESTASLSAPSHSHSVSPAPRPSHAFEPHPSFLRHKPSNPSTSRSTPDTQNDTSRGSPEAHPRNSPQQWVPPPSTVQGGGGSSLVADSYVGMHQSTPTVPEVYESAQGIPFPVTMIATTSTPQDAQYQVPTLGLPHGSSSLRMRSSEVGNVLDTQNVQKFDVRTQYPIGNQRPVPTAYTPNTPNKQWSGPSPVTSRTQYPSAGTAKVDMIPGMSSSQMHLGSVTSQNHLDTFSGLQDNVYDCSPIVLGPASSGALHQIEDQNPPQGTSSMVPESPRKKRRTGGRKRPALENQPIPSAYPGWSGASQATTLGAQYPAAAPSHMVPGLSSHTHAVAFPPVVDSCPSPSSSGLKDDLHGNDGIAPLISGSVSNGDLSQTEDYDLSQQGASPAASSERRKVRRAGKRKRKDDPKDKKGTERLRDQRQADADNLEKLCEILGAPEAQKKDLFAILVVQARALRSALDGYEQRSRNLDHGMDDCSTSPS